MKKILVTGGTGYIGSHATVELINAGYEVEILDNLFNSKIKVLDRIKQITGKKPKFYQVNLLDQNKLKQVFTNGHFDAVMHFAGLKAVGESVETPLLYYENNISGTLNLLNRMQLAGVKQLIFSSSATVYGVQDSPAYVETMRTGQNIPSPYGRTKYFIEEICKDFCAANPDFQISLLRYFNPIGAHSSGLLGEDPNGTPNNLMPIIMQVYDGRIKELSIYGDDYPTPDGTCLRDYIHVVDLAKGHLAALEYLKEGISVYNLGSGKATSVKELIAAFEQVSGKKLPYKITPRRAGDLPEFYADPSKAAKELSWHTELSISDAMKDTLSFLTNEKNIATHVE